MPITRINGVGLFWEQSGDAGPPLVLVHGSWGDHRNWDLVVPGFARRFRVFTYDRRGHSASERRAGQGHIDEDVADLAAFIIQQKIAPTHVVGNSFGAAVTLKLVAARPALLASIAVHEPPLLAMLGDHPLVPVVGQRIGAVIELVRAGKMAEGAEQFVENVGLGRGMWAKLAPDMRDTFVFNAPTFLDEMDEGPDVMAVDLERLSRFERPALVTRGTQSPPFFGVIVEQIAGALPRVQRHTYEGAGHVPHVTHTEEFVEVIARFVSNAISPGAAAAQSQGGDQN